MPYLQYVVPPLLEVIQREVEIVITDGDTAAPDAEDGWDTMTFEFKGLGVRVNSIFFETFCFVICMFLILPLPTHTESECSNFRAPRAAGCL